ncbi:MAG TPA: hypothetical protein VF813_10060, partial [Anaerolineaceae bacterium]
REGKGNKDRVVPLPQSVVDPLQAHMKLVAEQHRQDIAEGIGVSLPCALDKKYPSYPFSWAGTGFSRHARLALIPDGHRRKNLCAGISTKPCCKRL